MRYFQSYLRAAFTATTVLTLCVCGFGVFMFVQTAHSPDQPHDSWVGQLGLAFFYLAVIFAVLFDVVCLFAAIPVALSLNLSKRTGYRSKHYFALCGLLAGLVLDLVAVTINDLFAIGIGGYPADKVTSESITLAAVLLLPFLAAGLAAGWVFGAHLNAAARKPSASAALDLNP